jgi:hypothetical protein
MITLERLKEALEYNPESGLFVWKVRTGMRVRIDDVAGAISHGYVLIRLDGTLHRAHRLAWLWMTGAQPEEIDHINGCRSDNRWCNLRLATRTQNNGNSVVHKDKQKGVPKGVFWSAQNRKWLAQIQHRGKKQYLGYFSTVEAAHSAYLAAAKELFGEFVRSGR